MATRTNRAPGGLLDLLGAETGGRLPIAYDDFVRVSADAFELYAADQLCFISQQYTSTTFGSNSGSIQVPPTETWMLRGVAARAIINSADDIAWEWWAEDAPRADGDPASGSSPYILLDKLPLASSPVVSVSNNGDLAQWAYQFPRPPALKAGVTMGVRTKGQTGPARTVQIYWEISRFTK